MTIPSRSAGSATESSAAVVVLVGHHLQALVQLQPLEDLTGLSPTTDERESVTAELTETEQRNLRSVSDVLQYWNSHDVESVLSFYSEQIKWRNVAMEETYRGKAAVRRYLTAAFSRPQVRGDAQDRPRRQRGGAVVHPRHSPRRVRGGPRDRADRSRSPG